MGMVMEYYVLHAKALKNIFAFFKRDYVSKLVHECDKKCGFDDEQITQTQKGMGFTHESDKYFDGIEKN